MLVKEWMAKNPLVVDENTSIMKATQLMKEHRIRRIPVVREGRLVGIVSDRDIKEAAPSKATSLDVHELYYLLSEIKVKDIMTPNPLVLVETDSVERAAVIMLENKISGLPVINEDWEVVGIITQTDILKVMISISGIYHSPIQLAIELEDKPGALHELLVAMREQGARVVSVLTSKENVPEGFREVYIRIQDMNDDDLEKMKDVISKKYKILYVIKEDLSSLPKKEVKVPKKS
ncbi:CBS domain protein [Dissulfuribacter thermophilus]|uniref:CBS domain protein n=1 Tax=Dissulfuribacter thermophilus TaxID=1156395 RepID=A0A1B9F2R1_9BACT|nr:CBS and ACT domain-containing protein [Dissulfuribacter thermophilus]OCC14212.1 CBS domain protein [Dissulfuribacter thermophilus]